MIGSLARQVVANLGKRLGDMKIIGEYVICSQARQVYESLAELAGD